MKLKQTLNREERSLLSAAVSNEQQKEAKQKLKSRSSTPDLISTNTAKSNRSRTNTPAQSMETDTDTDVETSPDQGPDSDSDPELAARLQAKLAHLYGNSIQEITAESSIKPAENTRNEHKPVASAVDSGLEDQNGDKAVEAEVEEESYSFRLFSTNSNSKPSTAINALGNNKENNSNSGNYKIQKIRLSRSPSPHTLNGERKSGNFISSTRARSHYFTSANLRWTQRTIAGEFSHPSVALTTAQVQLQSKRPNPGLRIPWRVRRLRILVEEDRKMAKKGDSSDGKVLTCCDISEGYIQHGGIGNSRDKIEKSGESRSDYYNNNKNNNNEGARSGNTKAKVKAKPGKKRRIAIRERTRKLEREKLEKVREQEQREIALKQKRTQKNRDRKVKRRAKEKEKKKNEKQSGSELNADD
jgi:hypothetical protein